MQKIYAILLAILLSNTTMAQDTMPIIAYIGVPNDRTSEVNYQDLRDCGFDVSLHGYASLTQLIEACHVAEKHGVRILGHCPETHLQPEFAARQLINEPGFFGYVLQDEPSAPRITELEREIERLKSVDTTHCFYINLNPYYGKWILDIIKTKTYEEYVQIAAETSCRQISFDFYPVTDKGLRWGWFYNLEVIRAESLRSGKPFWGFVLSVPHILYPQPTLASMRLQAYTNLAYGAQAIQYFTYWTPEPTTEYDFHNGPISVDGYKTETYDLVRQMNTELRPIANLFYGAKVTDVSHIGIIPKRAKALKKAPTNIRYIKAEGKWGAVISQFTKDKNQYMAIVNKDHQNTLTLHIKSNDKVVRINKNMTSEKITNTYTIQPGDILLFLLQSKQ